MPWTPIQFAQQSAEDRLGVITLEKAQNFYLEANPAGSKAPVALRSVPGLSLWSTIGDGPVRGAIEMNGALYVVSGNELYHVTNNKAATLIGPVYGTSNVHMGHNGAHVVIATDRDLYCANKTTLESLPESRINGIAYQDGYLIYSQAGTQKFWISGLDDATDINALDFSTADAEPSHVAGCVSDHRELWVFKEDSVEIWWNAGDALFPFRRTEGGFIEHGCQAPGSIAKAENLVFWLGDNNTVYAAQGYQPKAISTPQIEYRISNSTAPDVAWAHTYQQAGHTFYVLSMPDLCLVYDLTTGLWHERKSYEMNRWRGNCYALFDGKHLVGDYSTGAIYELSDTTYDENGAHHERVAIAPPIYSQGQRVFHHELYIDIDAGRGLNDGQGSDPLVMLDWTDNGGRTWEQGMTASAGKIGEYLYRVTFNRLGMARQRTYRVSVSDPVSVTLLDAQARIEATP